MYGKEPDDSEVQQCIEDCLQCHAVCLETLRSCLETSGDAEPHMLEVLQDCSEMCQVTANCLMRGLDCYEIVCEACIGMCERCVDRVNPANGEWERCANTCRRCSESCSSLLANGVPRREEGG